MLNQKGMTVVELMISISVLAVVLGAAVTFLIFSQRQYTWIDTQARIQKELRATLQEMIIDIKEACSISDSSTANVMVLSLPNIDEYGDLYDDYDTIIYQPMPGDSTNLQMTLYRGANSNRGGWGKEISSGNPSIYLLTVGLLNSGSGDSPPLFTYNVNDIKSQSTEVTVTLKSRRVASFGKTQEGELSTSVRLRNKRI